MNASLGTRLNSYLLSSLALAQAALNRQVKLSVLV